MVYNPQPTYGSNTATGMVPGAITAPDPSADLAAQYPNLYSTNSAISSDILAGLKGQISQSDLNYMQDQSAGKAAASGMPGTNVMSGTLMGNRSARDIGKMQYQVQQDAINNYNKTIPTVSNTQTLSPTLQTEIAGTNAVNAASPNPASAQSYAQQLYDQHLQAARGPGGGTTATGGSGGPAGGTMPTTQSSPSYGSGGTYGATGSGGATMYPGYTWDARTGTYVAQAKSPGQGTMTDGSQDWTIGGNATQYPGGTTYVQSAADLNDLFGDGSSIDETNWAFPYDIGDE